MGERGLKMGMFSWKCKGCGRELVEGERVRLNGCKGEYDGYGRAGGFDYDGEDPVAWHQRCYKKATTEQKLDETPSEHAPNQGFGYRCLEFLKGYDPKTPIEFDVKVDFMRHTDTPNGEFSYETENHDFFLTEDGLRCQKDWEAQRIEIERNDESLSYKDVISKIGIEPMCSAKKFSSFEAAHEAAIKAVSNFDNCTYEISIWGTQNIVGDLNYPVCGIVFEMEHREKIIHKTEKVFDSTGVESVTYTSQRTYEYTTKDTYRNPDLVCQTTPSQSV